MLNKHKWNLEEFPGYCEICYYSYLESETICSGVSFITVLIYIPFGL